MSPLAAAALAIATLLACEASAAASEPGAAGVIIRDVTVISPERATPLRHADVILRDGRIAALGAHLAAGPGLQRIDGRGRFLIPGLIVLIGAWRARMKQAKTV